MTPKILLVTTCRWFPTARLAMALAKAGCIVDVVCPPRHPFGKTRAVRSVHNYYGLMPLKSFARGITATNPDLVIPGDDLAAQHLYELYLREKRRGKAGEKMCALIERSIGAHENFPILFERTAFMQLAQKEGVRVPETEVIADSSDLKRWIERSNFPTVLKANGTSGGDGVKVVHTAEEAENALRKLQAPPLLARAIKRALIDNDRTLVWPSLLRRRSIVNAQKFVAGREATSAVACWKGTVLGALHFEVLKKADTAGHATVMCLIENADMAFAVKTMVCRLNLSGLHGFDFMIQGNTEKAYLIEINPRSTQVGHLTFGPGRDLPAALNAALTGNPPRTSVKITENDTITLFPQEWIRDPESAFLKSGYHDVPWEEPDLVLACVRSRRKQSGWYSHRDQAKPKTFSLAHSSLSSHDDRSVKRSQGSPWDKAPNNEESKPLQIMKFGGTSVGDAACVKQVVEIIESALPKKNVVVVVSAMSGVTNKLVEIATQAEVGNSERVAAIFNDLRALHDSAVNSLFNSPEDRAQITPKMQQCFQEVERLCAEAVAVRKMTPQVKDVILSLGERLSSPLVATALAKRGIASEAVEATKLVVTDSNHGAADPLADATRERCELHLRHFISQGVVPIVTGFIGATKDGALTTLGRGGSDYSATILGAALDADEVIIWTDVNGLLTADPRLVSSPRTIPEISYQEAAELAHFGAKVLHQKTLRPVAQSGAPVWIRNTFAPQLEGTKITPEGPTNSEGVKGLAAIRDVALITIAGDGIARRPDVLDRIFATTAAIRADVLMLSQSPTQNSISLVIPSSLAKLAVEALRQAYSEDLLEGDIEYIVSDPNVAAITMVGQKINGTSGTIERMFGALDRQNVSIIANAYRSSEWNISFVVAQKDMQAAIVAAHDEFELGNSELANILN